MATIISRITVLGLILAVLVSSAPVATSTLLDNVAVQWNRLFNLIHCRSSGAIQEPNIMLAQMHLSQWHALLALRRLSERCTTEDVVVAYASHTVLSNYFPYEQPTTIDPLLQSQLTALGVTDTQKRLGKQLGEAVALDVIGRRRPAREFALDALKSALDSDANDPDYGVYRYLNNTPAGRAAAAFGFYNMPVARPYVVPDPIRYIKEHLGDLKPPKVPSAQWDREYDLVKDVGRADWEGRTREMNSTPAVVGCAKVNSTTCYPDNIWSAIARASLPKETSLYDTVVTFAKLSVTLHDALIVLSILQYGFWFWRPEMAMKAGDPHHAPIPNWTPYFRTPPHAEYPSGTVTTFSAGAVVLQNFFGRRRSGPFTLTEGGVYAASCPVSGPVPEVRFNSYADAVRFGQRARVWAGAHFNVSVVDAVKVGESVAHYVEEHWGETAPSGVLPDLTYLDVIAKLPKKQGDWSPIRLGY